MKLVLQEEKYELLKVLTDNIKEYTYFDKFGRVAQVRYEIFEDTFFDINGKTKRQRRNSPALVYNLPSILKSKKENQNTPIIIVESEKLADYINKKCKNVVATTILNGIDRNDISEKTIELFRNTDVYIVCYYNEEYNKLKEQLSLVTDKIKMINCKNVDTIDVTTEISYLLKILEDFKNKN